MSAPEDVSAASVACDHDRVTWWPHGQECDACGALMRVRQDAEAGANRG